MTWHARNTDTLRGQFVLRVTSMVLRLVADARRKVEPKIKQSLKLRDDSTTSNGYPTFQSEEDPSPHFATPRGDRHGSSSTDSVDMIQLQADLEAQREEINRIDSAGFQVVSSFQSAISRVEQQMRQLNDTIESIKRDADGQRDDFRSLKSEVSEVKWESQNSGVISRLDQQLQTTDRVVTELRQAINGSKSEASDIRDDLSAAQQELHLLRGENDQLKAQLEETKQVAREGVHTAKEYGVEVSTLRREIKQLRSELGRERAKPTPENSSSFVTHQLDILTNNVSKISNKASQVESLQMEVELLKTRVVRLESQNNAGANRNNDHGPTDDFVSQPGRLSQQNYGGSALQKRTSTGRDVNDLFLDSPPKRIATTSDYSSAATASYGSNVGWQQSSPPGSAFDTEGTGLRLTKSGRVDKRTTKRGGSNSGPGGRLLGTKAVRTTTRSP